MGKVKAAFVLIAIVLFATMGWCGSSSGAADIVTVQRMNNLYYKVDINMLSASHYKIGRSLALQIKKGVPDYEQQVDAGLKAMVDLMRGSIAPLPYFNDFGIKDLVKRAKDIFTNVPKEYQDEIRGMQSVFSSTDDTLGNGKLSQNKILIYNLAPDVMRVMSCSASAAFGSMTVSGKTIVGRNLEWYDKTLPNMAAMHAVVQIHNGRNSVVLFGFLGQMIAISGFNASRVFGAILDSPVDRIYSLRGGERSYPMDLRYALENQTTLQGVADTFSGKSYAYDFNIFLADAKTSSVLEVDIHKPFCGLRTSTSKLKSKEETKVEILPWNFPDAIACVNWFTLKGTSDNTGGEWWTWDGNAPRWSTFIDLYKQYSGHSKITMDAMKAIMGYNGSWWKTGCAKYGAIWRYNDDESEVQAIVMDMDTLETWVSFQPPSQHDPLQSPNYIQVFSSNPFKN